LAFASKTEIAGMKPGNCEGPIRELKLGAQLLSAAGGQTLAKKVRRGRQKKQ
jgi:hypothetical protein